MTPDKPIVSDTVELLPCPHEHEQRVLGLSIVPLALGNAPRWHVRCLDCGASGPRTGTEQTAVEAWNTRSPLSHRASPTYGEPAADWVMVPREPTEAMIEAGRGAVVAKTAGPGSFALIKSPTDKAVSAYRAMLAASPVKQPVGEVTDALAKLAEIDGNMHRDNPKEFYGRIAEVAFLLRALASNPPEAPTVEADKQKVREGEWIELSSESYPVAETAVVSYFDQDVGEWVLAIKDAPIETSPWTHFLRTGRPTAGELG